MTQKNPFSKIVLATSNQGKLKEFQHEISQWGIDLQSYPNLKSPIEDGSTFVENALIKARSGALQTGMPCIADDSGIIVPALGGAPGIYSARYAEMNGSELSNTEYLLSQMNGVANREAHFYVCLVLVRSHEDQTPIIACGQVKGELTQNQIGDQGHGYDPIFYYSDFEQTFAQIPLYMKNKISHRAEALLSLKAQLKSFGYI